MSLSQHLLLATEQPCPITLSSKTDELLPADSGWGHAQTLPWQKLLSQVFASLRKQAPSFGDVPPSDKHLLSFTPVRTQ